MLVAKSDAIATVQQDSSLTELTGRLDVMKATGEKTVFSEHKLTASLCRTGADQAMVQEVLRQLN
jgi:hypothetical protein